MNKNTICLWYNGDAEAAAIYTDSFGKNPDFFQFYKSLEGYRAAFSKPSDIMVVDPSSDFFRYMKSPQGEAP